MAITREQVLHVAKLAHLDLTDEEVDKFREQLSAILDAVSKVSELDLADVPPTYCEAARTLAGIPGDGN